MGIFVSVISGRVGVLWQGKSRLFQNSVMHINNKHKIIFYAYYAKNE
jgi:hypothetical protein